MQPDGAIHHWAALALVRAVAIGMVVLDVRALTARYSSAWSCSVPRLCLPVHRLIMRVTSAPARDPDVQHAKSNSAIDHHMHSNLLLQLPAFSATLPPLHAVSSSQNFLHDVNVGCPI